MKVYEITFEKDFKVLVKNPALEMTMVKFSEETVLNLANEEKRDFLCYVTR
jgi:hypothetical protein